MPQGRPWRPGLRPWRRRPATRSTPRGGCRARRDARDGPRQGRTVRRSPTPGHRALSRARAIVRRSRPRARPIGRRPQRDRCSVAPRVRLRFPMRSSTVPYALASTIASAATLSVGSIRGASITTPVPVRSRLSSANNVARTACVPAIGSPTPPGLTGGPSGKPVVQHIPASCSSVVAPGRPRHRRWATANRGSLPRSLPAVDHPGNIGELGAGPVRGSCEVRPRWSLRQHEANPGSFSFVRVPEGSRTFEICFGRGAVREVDPSRVALREEQRRDEGSEAAVVRGGAKR